MLSCCDVSVAAAMVKADSMNLCPSVLVPIIGTNKSPSFASFELMQMSVSTVFSSPQRSTPPVASIIFFTVISTMIFPFS